MDKVKEMIEKVVKKVQSDEDFAKNFKKDPVKAVEGILGIDLPDDQINAIIDGVKAKITVDSAKGFADKIKGLFDKK